MMRSRPTFLHGAITACVLTAVITGCGADDGGSTTSASAGATTTTLAPIALAVGESATIDGVAVTVTDAEVTDSVNEGLARGRFLVVDVSLTNGSDADVAYSPPSWSLQAGRAATSVYPISDVGRLEFGTLAPGATVEGVVGFELGSYEGAGEVQYRPPRSEAVAAAWSVTL
jgi:hypothetical protein